MFEFDFLKYERLLDEMFCLLGPDGSDLLRTLHLFAMLAAYRHPDTAVGSAHERWVQEELRQLGAKILPKLDQEQMAPLLELLHGMTGTASATKAALRAWSGLSMRDGTRVKGALP